jgi:hypothetical protein
MTTPAADLLSQRIPGEAARLAGLAAGRSLSLRITGSIAVLLLSGDIAGLPARLGRRPYHDIDFWALDSDRRRIVEFFAAEGYQVDPESLHLREWGIKRLIFGHPESAIKVDVFMDELVMAHTIPFADRLQGDSPCVPPADLLLSKLQIHEITANDFVDLTLLLLSHEPGEERAGAIGLDRCASILAQDWGFWYDAMQNLAALAEAVTGYPALAEDDRATVLERVEILSRRFDSEPKSRRWQRRARAGTRKPWYEQVSEV